MLILWFSIVNNYPRSLRKLVFIIFCCRWPGWKWIIIWKSCQFFQVRVFSRNCNKLIHSTFVFHWRNQLIFFSWCSTNNFILEKIFYVKYFFIGLSVSDCWLTYNASESILNDHHFKCRVRYTNDFSLMGFNVCQSIIFFCNDVILIHG